MMTFHFTNEQKIMKTMVRKFVHNEIKPIVSQMEQENCFPHEVIEKMGKQGLMGISIPEKYGGSGMDFISYIIAIHEISKVSPAIGVILSVHTSVGTKPILHFGNAYQKECYVKKLASGKYIGAFALTEPNAGSDASNIKLKAVNDGEYYLLTGSKIFITNGKEADTFITFAQTVDATNNAKGISAFI